MTRDRGTIDARIEKLERKVRSAKKDNDGCGFFGCLGMSIIIGLILSAIFTPIIGLPILLLLLVLSFGVRMINEKDLKDKEEELLEAKTYRRQIEKKAMLQMNNEVRGISDMLEKTTCQYCKETIMKGAKICKHCQSDLK